MNLTFHCFETQTNIDNSATLSELKKDFNAVLLEKQVRILIELYRKLEKESIPQYRPDIGIGHWASELHKP